MPRHILAFSCVCRQGSGIIVMSNFASEILDFLFVNFSVFLIWSVTFLMFNSTCLIFHPCFYAFFPLSVLFLSHLLQKFLITSLFYSFLHVCTLSCCLNDLSCLLWFCLRSLLENFLVFRGSVATDHPSILPFQMLANVILPNRFYCRLNKVKIFYFFFLALCWKCTSEE